LYQKQQRFNNISFKERAEKAKKSKSPLAADGSDAFFGAEDFLGCFQGGAKRVVSPSDADEPESNKSSARAEARVTSLPHAKVEDVYTINFLLGFKGLARASSCAEV
jgi:hypothetical protein